MQKNKIMILIYKVQLYVKVESNMLVERKKIKKNRIMIQKMNHVLKLQIINELENKNIKDI